MYKFYYTIGHGLTSYARGTLYAGWRQIYTNPDSRRWLMRMSFTCFFLFFIFLQISMAANAQKISLLKKNANLIELFKDIRQQTGYDFMFPKELLHQAHPVSLHVKDVELKEVLEICFKDQPFSYEITNRTIVVRQIQKSFIDRLKERLRQMEVRGRVTDTLGNPVTGATITIKGTNQRTISNEKGEFYLPQVDEKAVIVISYVGYHTQELPAANDLGTIVLNVSAGKLEEINVILNTGYQTLPKERATGSFEHINNELFNRQIGTNLLDRLDGIASSVMFDNRPSSSRDISIRGLSTIFSDRKPLIVLNNFPYEGDINDINPNDIDNITILKDAAAASIWGVRAGNGVIVVMTKKAKKNQSPTVSFNNHISIVEKPDMMQLPSASIKEYIEAEKMLFDLHFYDANEQMGFIPLSPAVELMYQNQRGLLSNSELTQKLNELANYDIRHELNKYIYRSGLNQQYALNVSGQNDLVNYYLSGGYDDNTSTTNGGYKRYNLRSDNTFYLSKKLSADAGVFFTHTLTSQGRSTDFSTLYPYARFADDAGNALPISRYFRAGYLEEALSKGFLDWEYRPLDEINLVNNKDRKNSLIIHAGLDYRMLKGLNAQIKYQYEYAQLMGKDLRSLATYYTRNEINRYSQVQGNEVTYRPIPLGDILNENIKNNHSQSFRFQLNYSNTWNKHQLTSLAGAEARQAGSDGFRSVQYGYDPTVLTFGAINHDVNYPLYNPYGGSSKIAYAYSAFDNADRFISFFTNWGYSFDNRYHVNFSIRKDGSNYFGVKSNQKFTPLWSLGASWTVTNESFVNSSWLDLLKLRATFGYSGNLNRNVSALPTMRYYNGGNLMNVPYGSMTNPPNANLRWEKNGQFNAGVDFAVLKQRLSGSVEFYHKKNTDLLGYMPLDQTTGALNPINSRGFSYLGNSASMVGNGIDVQLKSVNLRGALEWRTDLLYSTVKTRVTKYLIQTNEIDNYINGGLVISPLIGKPAYSIFAFRWGGLHPETGEPMGYLQGDLSKDYASIRNQTNPEELIYFGSATPTHFGAVRNTFSWKRVSLSFNISYKLGFFFRRSSVFYGTIYSGTGLHSDFSKRWQKPGDELFTDVPSMVYPQNANRDGYFYPRGAILISKGDNIRLQDVNLNYQLKSSPQKGTLKKVELLMYATNLGIIWKADKHDVDPEFGNLSPLKTISFGLRAGF